jgi:hypothetical protein
MLSNSETILKATDTAIAKFATRDGDGEVSRVEFLQFVSEKFLAEELAAQARKPTKSGDVREATEGDYAAHALGVWAEARAKVLGKADVRPVKESRKSELSAIFRAATARPDIVKATREMVSALAAQAERAAAEAQKSGRSLDASEKFTVRSYDAIVKVARAQVKAFTEHGEAGRFSDDDIRDCFAPTESTPDEARDLEGVIKKLGVMAKRFPANASVYEATAKALAATLTALKTGATAKASRDDFIAKAVAQGHSAETAAAFYDAPRQTAPDGGRVLQAA